MYMVFFSNKLVFQKHDNTKILILKVIFLFTQIKLNISMLLVGILHLIDVYGQKMLSNDSCCNFANLKLDSYFIIKRERSVMRMDSFIYEPKNHVHNKFYL